MSKLRKSIEEKIDNYKKKSLLVFIVGSIVALIFVGKAIKSNANDLADFFLNDEYLKISDFEENSEILETTIIYGDIKPNRYTRFSVSPIISNGIPKLKNVYKFHSLPNLPYKSIYVVREFYEYDADHEHLDVYNYVEKDAFIKKKTKITLDFKGNEKTEVFEDKSDYEGVSIFNGSGVPATVNGMPLTLRYIQHDIIFMFKPPIFLTYFKDIKVNAKLSSPVATNYLWDKWKNK